MAAFVLGLIVGANLGALIMALVVASARREREKPETWEEFIGSARDPFFGERSW